MGVVYRAEHAWLDRPVAVKLLPKERATPYGLARFACEARLTGMLSHPNVVSVFDYGRAADETYYYAMEYLDGLGLDDLIESHGPQAPSRVIRILLQIADALNEIHEAGFVHCDIKPSNIIVCKHKPHMPDLVKVFDFGLVQEAHWLKNPCLRPPRYAENAENAESEVIVGTPLYMAPESIRTPLEIDHRVDIYALGAVGYLLLSGKPVFPATDWASMCNYHLNIAPQPLPRLTTGTCSPRLETLILRCLAKAPRDRFATAADLYEELAALARESPWTKADARDWWKEHCPQAATHPPSHTAVRHGTDPGDSESSLRSSGEAWMYTVEAGRGAEAACFR